MTRFLIVFGLILGIGFWISSKNEEKKQEIKTETTKTTEKTEEIIDEITDENAETENESESNETDENIEKEASVENQNTTASPKQNPTEPEITNVTTPAKKEVYSDNTTETKVFLYEWGIDISEKEIPEGKVIFNIVNNGKFTHEFNIRNVKNYGKILPGKPNNLLFPFVRENLKFIPIEEMIMIGI